MNCIAFRLAPTNVGTVDSHSNPWLRYDAPNHLEAQNMNLEKSDTVSIPEASKLISRPENTIRDWVKNELVNGFRDDRGRWRVDRSSLLVRASEIATTRPSVLNGPQRTVTGATYSKASSEPVSEVYVQSLVATVEHERKINDELRHQVNHLQTQLVQLTHEMKAMLDKQSPLDGVLSRWLRK